MIFKNWPFFLFKRRLVKWIDNEFYPYFSQLPETIRLPNNIWYVIKEIKKNTEIDGAERAVTILDIDGLMIFTPTIIGESERVLLKHQFKVEYQYDPNNQRCYRRIYRDNRLIIKDYFLTQRPPSKIRLRVLFNIHTHPHGESANFFSDTDIKSFLENPKVGAIILVAQDIWLLLKTRETKERLNLSRIEPLNPFDLVKEKKLAVYRGKIKERLKRIETPIYY